MSGRRKYKWEKGDVVGFYTVIKPLPREPHVKNLIIYATCNLCGEKVERYSNRLDSFHTDCAGKADYKKSLLPPEPERIVIAPAPHTRKTGVTVADIKQAMTPETLDVELQARDLGVSADVMDYLNFDIDKELNELVAQGQTLPADQQFIFKSSLRRYVYLVKLSRRLEVMLSNYELTVIGSSGNEVANPMLVQYKQVSAEATAVGKSLRTMLVSKASEVEDDPLAKALGL
jgi:hypothetical protein